jgi:hypothetical protein
VLSEAIICTSRGKSSGPPGVGSSHTSSSRKSRVSSWIRQGREVCALFGSLMRMGTSSGVIGFRACSCNIHPCMYVGQRDAASDLGASADTTVTWLDALGPKLPAELPCPVTLTVFFTVAFSPWVATKVHDPLPPAAMLPNVSQFVLFLVPTLPAVQAGPANPEAVKMLPYALSHIWSTTILPKFEVLVTATV